MLYVTFIPSGSDIRGLGIAAALAQAVAAKKGAGTLKIVIALLWQGRHFILGTA